MGDQLKGVLFDFDDTLIDWSGVERSWRDLEAAGLARVQTWLERRRIGPSLDLESLVDVYMRRTRTAWMEARTSLRAPFMPTILMSTLHELGLDIDRLEQADVVRAYDWNAVPGTVVFPDVPPMLDKLRAAGLKLGIVTNASQPMAMRDAELAAHGIIGYFPDCRLSAADAGYLKPHPQIFKSALERLGTAPEETVFRRRQSGRRYRGRAQRGHTRGAPHDLPRDHEWQLDPASPNPALLR